MKKLAVAYVRVDALTPYAKNARTHSEAQISQLVASIRKFGWTNPILIDGAKGVIAGHGRLMAAKALGMTEVPVIELSGLTAAEKRAYILADNKLALNAGWDDGLLAEELRSLGEQGFNLALTGFDEHEWQTPTFAPGTVDDQGKLDELAPKMVCCPGCGHSFDSRGHEQS